MEREHRRSSSYQMMNRAMDLFNRRMRDATTPHEREREHSAAQEFVEEMKNIYPRTYRPRDMWSHVPVHFPKEKRGR